VPVRVAWVPLALLAVSVPAMLMVAPLPMVTVAPGAIVTVTPEAMLTLPSCWPSLHVVSDVMSVVPPASPVLPPPEVAPELVPPLLLPLPPLPEPVPPPPEEPVPLLLEGCQWSWGGASGPADEHAASARTPGATMESATESLSDSTWKNMRQTPRGG
jgi:hypothetical protein